MEELQFIQSTEDIEIFIEIWKEYNKSDKLKKVIFTISWSKLEDLKELIEILRKYFRKFIRYEDSLICSDIIPLVHPQSPEEHKSE